ncbi:MAG TPA: outer membrane protein assembly factor BamD [Terriglobia bacterium]|nr:outer membrane protein assembly factor BamD [Terriglobia bacterium]
MKRHSLICSLIVALGLAIAEPPSAIAQTPRENSEAKKLFNEGVAFQHDGNFVEAEKKFRAAMRRYPRAENADRTAYYLIDTLKKLKRVQDARAEIDNFRRSYPQSKWLADVNEMMFMLGGQPDAPTELSIWNTPAELREAQARADLLRGATTPIGPPNKIYAPEFPPNASMEAEYLQLIVQRDSDRGIEVATDMLRANPSDRAVLANLGIIANSDSPRAVPFLLSVWGNTAAPPNMRNSAFFWFSRRNPDKSEVAKAIMDLLAKRETEHVASEALFRMTVADHRAVLEKIVTSSNPDKFALMEKIYRNGSELLRTDLLMFVGRLDSPKAVPFIAQAAQNDKDLSVRRAAAQILANRKDVDVQMLETLMKSSTPPPVPRPPQPGRAPQPFVSTGPAFPTLPQVLGP